MTYENLTDAPMQHSMRVAVYDGSVSISNCVYCTVRTGEGQLGRVLVPAGGFFPFVSVVVCTVVCRLTTHHHFCSRRMHHGSLPTGPCIMHFFGGCIHTIHKCDVQRMDGM